MATLFALVSKYTHCMHVPGCCSLVIDTCPQMCRLGLIPDDVLNNIGCIKVYNTADQLYSLSRIASELDMHKICLIIVDSSIAHYRVEYQGLGELPERQQHLNQFLNQLRHLASTYNCVAVITNQVSMLSTKCC